MQAYLSSDLILDTSVLKKDSAQLQHSGDPALRAGSRRILTSHEWDKDGPVQLLLRREILRLPARIKYQNHNKFFIEDRCVEYAFIA